jgi:hypothetical protein
LPFRREERLGRLACARGPLAIITARVVLLFPVVEQGLPRLFSDYFNRPKRWKVSRRNANFVSFRTMKLRARLQLN